MRLDQGFVTPVKLHKDREYRERVQTVTIMGQMQINGALNMINASWT